MITDKAYFDLITRTAEVISNARRSRLNQALKGLAAWADARTEEPHDTDTTLTMLERRVAKIRGQVEQAGWDSVKGAK